jgi:hypothetical protein
MNKHTALISSLFLSLFLHGCQSHRTDAARTDGAGTACANVRRRVFEISRDIADKAIPEIKRRNIENSYSVSEVSKADITLLLNNISSKPGMLTDHSRTISGWPGIADSWSYTIVEGVLNGSSSGAGFVGVRNINGSNEIRIEYNVTHTINTLKPISSKVIYEGLFPKKGSLAILTPFKRKDGAELVHILLFDATNWELREP